MNRYHVAAVTSLQGDWRLDGYQKSVIELKHLMPLLINERLENIKLDDIAWKGKDLYPQKSGNNCYCCFGEKYRNCDTKYPLIIAKNASDVFIKGTIDCFSVYVNDFFLKTFFLVFAYLVAITFHIVQG